MQTPTFFSPTQNYKGQEMLTLENFLWELDSNKPDFFSRSKEKGKIRANLASEAECN